MFNLRPFRFSVISDVTKSRQAWLDMAQRAEGAGYTSFVLPDHFNLDVDPAVGLMAIADATSLRIGSHVFCNDFRHPILLARQAANLDFFSDGRFQFGLGCGYLATDYDQLDLPFDPAGVRISRFEEALKVIKQYFHEEEVNFAGKHYRINGIKPSQFSQRPHPPIYVGGGGRRVLSIAAREADIVGLVARNNATGLDWKSALPEANLEKITWLREAAGERFSQLELSSTIFIAAVTEHSHGAAQNIGHHLGLTAEEALNCMHTLIGSVDQIVEELQKRRELFGISCIEIAGTSMDAIAPVVARLAGK